MRASTSEGNDYHLVSVEAKFIHTSDVLLNAMS